ncbi:hypothetical protein Ddye_018860, partial [Dipteronia dyeriana]
AINRRSNCGQGESDTKECRVVTKSIKVYNYIKCFKPEVKLAPLAFALFSVSHEVLSIRQASGHPFFLHDFVTYFSLILHGLRL